MDAWFNVATDPYMDASYTNKHYSVGIKIEEIRLCLQIYITYYNAAIVVDFCNLKLCLEYTLNRKKKKRFVGLSDCWLTDRRIQMYQWYFLKFVFILMDIGPAPRNFLLDPLNFCRTYIFYVKLF